MAFPIPIDLKATPKKFQPKIPMGTTAAFSLKFAYKGCVTVTLIFNVKLAFF